MKRNATVLAAAALLAFPVPAMATDEAFEFWLNPSIAFDLDDDTTFELETAQRFRDADDGRPDTYFFRGWLHQDLNDNLTLSGAVEQRINDGGSDETRIIQQLSASSGILRGRMRLEQRFVEGNDGRMGLRLRPRAGVAVPLDDEGRWSAGADVELFWTLRGNSPASDTGITGMRTQIGVGYEVSDNLEIGLTYLRDQDFEDGPDEVGHAPLIGIEWSF
ncbi:DUF2490 domain-containing protein [Aurantiacibacter gangjinensis]|uniref:Uncharacterized protein n=1 Tax=Aurantiacibacter gangjinensis TaxID=502682 RepID=A0A0G9MRN2_9SPHN|nr:DUF2490 domain-containing protein [Aurantiacibacter gangjinensis]APE29121.1 hypothetical protein BMF35_a2292 [Aurantiacibacter gangjinensis]KLE33204.1 hypothetical protein AAW01_04345 [Aurantiacibacter gangjinensis]